jgi:hypothetical protein
MSKDTKKDLVGLLIFNFLSLNYTFPSIFCNDDVVEESDAEQVGAGLEAVGYFDVVGADFEVSAGVIVGYDDRGGAVGDGVGKDFAGVN